jgi:hypothetical protein
VNVEQAAVPPVAALLPLLLVGESRIPIRQLLARIAGVLI